MTSHNSRLVPQILVAMVLGAVVGDYFGPQVAGLGNIGKIYIQLIKGVAVPLVFFSIVEALITTQLAGRHAGRLFFITGINACFAATLGLTLSNLIRPGESLNFREMSAGINDKTLASLSTQKLDFSQILAGYLPDNIVKPFYDGNLIAVVILALFFGIAARRLLHHEVHGKIFKREAVSGAILFSLKIFEEILLWLVCLVPFAVFGVMAKVVGEYGFKPFSGLLLYVGVALLGLIVHSCVVYPIWISYIAGVPLKKFLQHARQPLVYAFGTNSSLATLPLTLKALDDLHVPKSASRLGACVGTNLNNDGILLYEAMAVLFVAQAHGIVMPLEQQIFTALLCVVAAVGVAGIPEAGVVSLSLVLTTTGMPVEILPLLLTVDWLVARGRSVVNVMSDMTVSIALGSWEEPETVTV